MADVVRGADPSVVGPWLAGALGDERWRDCRVSLIAGGKSNLTFEVASGAGSVVLRRPPLGELLPSAHDMLREHTVMSALAVSPVPVPRMLALCQDRALLGQPFYVMERVDGHVCRDALPPGYADDPASRRLVGEGVVDVLADLHQVDPEEVGLGQFGRAEGYLARQVRRWGQQWEATRLPGHGDLDALHLALTASVPASARAGVVHGDYRLDNTLLDPARPGRVAAVLDWEMATLGDPLADLGLMLVYWSQADDSADRAAAAVVPSATSLDGFPDRREVAELYARRTGADLSALPWAQALGFYKMAVVCAGIVARASAGSMLGDGFDVADRIAPLTALGADALATGELR